MDFVNSFFHVPKKMLIVYFKFYHINGCCTAPIIYYLHMFLHNLHTPITTYIVTPQKTVK